MSAASFDVFVSWTRASADAGEGVRALRAALEGAGLRVWLDETAIDPFDSIPAGIRVGLSESALLVAWYSREYPTRRACREELTLGLLAAERAGQGPQRVLVINPEDGLDHVVEARLLDRRFAGPADLADLDVLAGRIADRTAAVPGPFGELPAADSARWYGGAGWHGSSSRFVGRLDVLWRVHDRLQRRTGLVGPGEAGRAVALVSGFGGVGKSLLAAEYANLFASCYPGGVVWLSGFAHNPARGERLEHAAAAAAARATADAQLAQVARWLDLNPEGENPDQIREMIKSEVLGRRERLLWIVDDLPTGLTPAELDAWRCPTPVTAELITTRDEAHSRLDPIRLDVLDPAAALALLTQDRPLPPAEREAAEMLAADLGYHPLGCDVAGLYIAGGSTFTAYRRFLGAHLDRFDQLADLLADQLPGGHVRQLGATLGTSLSALGADAWQLLRTATALAAAPISRDLLIDTRRHLNRDIADPPIALDRDAAELAVQRGLRDPHRDGLWRYDPESDTVTLHVLVGRAAAALDPQPRLHTTTRAAAVAALIELFTDNANDARAHPVLALPAEHARHLTTPSTGGESAASTPDLTIAALTSWVGRYDHVAGRYQAAAAALERSLTDLERVLGPDHPDTLTSRNDLAVAYQDAGRRGEALPLYERTLTDLERVLGPDHPTTATSRDNLAGAYQAAGRLGEALPLYERTLTDRERVLGPDHPDTLTSRDNLAVAYQDAGRTGEALTLMEATLANRERILGPDHPDTLTCRTQLHDMKQAGRLKRWRARLWRS